MTKSDRDRQIDGLADPSVRVAVALVMDKLDDQSEYISEVRADVKTILAAPALRLNDEHVRMVQNQYDATAASIQTKIEADGAVQASQRTVSQKLGLASVPVFLGVIFGVVARYFHT